MVNLMSFANLSGWIGGKILKGVPKKQYLKFCPFNLIIENYDRV